MLAKEINLSGQEFHLNIQNIEKQYLLYCDIGDEIDYKICKQIAPVNGYKTRILRKLSN